MSGSSQQLAAVPAQLIPMSAGEIVKLLPRLSRGLIEAVLGCPERLADSLSLVLNGRALKKLFELTLKPSFGAELEAQVGCRLGGAVASNVILQQLSLCLLLAIAASVPELHTISIWLGRWRGGRMYFGEQAVEVLCYALVTQHLHLPPDKGVRRLHIYHSGPFGTDTGCAHLAHLLKSRHCKLQKLQMWQTATGAGGIDSIARALRTNSSLTELKISWCPEVGDGGVEKLAAMLRTNSTLHDLTLRDIGMTAHGLRHLCAALSTQQSPQATSRKTSPSGTFGGLKKLVIYNDKIGKGGAAHLGAMLANNGCLRTLRMIECSLVDEEGHIAKGLRENSTLECLDLSRNKQLGKMAMGLLVRSLATNNNSNLMELVMNDMGEMPAAVELAHMITSNHSLVHLSLKGASYSANEWASIILPALGRNRTLVSIDLAYSPGVEGEEVRAAFFYLLRINTTIRYIHLSGTPLDEDGHCQPVEEELRRNTRFRDALSALPKEKPKSCRIILCGHAYAGKTSLLQTMKLLQQDARPMSSSELENNNYEVDLKDKELSKRTRGIDIHLLKDEEDIRISVWDLAGHREYHAFHDVMFPSGNNSATLFVLTFSPVVSPADELRAGQLKPMRELEEELQYWLRFIASNCKLSAGPPTAVVVITHKDTLANIEPHVELWLLSAQDIVASLAGKFSGRVKVQPQPFMVNALASQDVQLRAWVTEVERSLRSTLDDLSEEPAICTQVLKAVKDVSRTSFSSPIISRAKFGSICRALVPGTKDEMEKAEDANNPLADHDGEGPTEEQLDSGDTVGESEAQDEAHQEVNIEMESESEVDIEMESELEAAAEETADDGLLTDSEWEEFVKDIESHDDMLRERVLQVEKDVLVRLKEAANGDKFGEAVAAYLHDAGEIIHHHKLNIIVSNPKWFCHGVLGQLIDLFPSSSAKTPWTPKNGLVSKKFLSSLLEEAVKSVPGLDQTVVTTDQLIQLMLCLDLCYEQTPSDSNTAYFLPALFDDEGNKAADGKRSLTWRKFNTSTFVGRRLQCGDLERTFLSDGFFPCLQVVLHNYALKEKWVEDTHSSNYMLEKNLFNIWVNGMEIFIEFSGSTGYFLDILVKSSNSHQQTMEFLRPNIIGTIRTFCASQEGCQGVTLAEAIIRPECLYRAQGGNPILCTHRRDQSVLVEELTKKMGSIPDWQHCWNEVKDGAGRLVLPNGQHSGKVLLDGPKDVPPRPEPNWFEHHSEEVCYPDDNRKLGKSRGLALIVSMEKGRTGGAVDRGRLETLFRACGFNKVVVLVDLLASDSGKIINSVLEDNVLEEDECFLCSINGHGGTQDGKPYILDENKSKIMVNLDIVDPFRQTEHLRGKPKVFLINACRGDSTLCDKSDIVGAHISHKSDSVGAHTDGQQVTGSPRPQDCLLVFSTSEGSPSCRHPVDGTVFVNQLMQTVMENKETTDVLSMMTMVNDRVNEVQSHREDPQTQTTTIVGQCCEVQHSLRKKLYWKGV